MEVTVLTSNPTNFNRITQLLKVVVIQYICVEAPNLKWIYNTVIFLSLQDQHLPSGQSTEFWEKMI